MNDWFGDVTYVTVACRGIRRYFDLDAVRHDNPRAGEFSRTRAQMNRGAVGYHTGRSDVNAAQNPAGAPPSDFHIGDGLPDLLVAAMCPERVCTVCGKPSERIVARDGTLDQSRPQAKRAMELAEAGGLTEEHFAAIRSFGTHDAGKAIVTQTGAGKNTDRVKTLASEAKAVLGGYFREFLLEVPATVGWSDCGHDAWRTGVILDPFTGGDPMSIEYRVGDVFDRLQGVPDNSIDLIVTSPPFLDLRVYLPDDHPDKAKELGSEENPAEFIDALLALTAELGRVLAPHGSLCVELGDTYSGAGGNVDNRETSLGGNDLTARPPRVRAAGWPLAKSLTGTPTLYPWSLAYGRNLLTGEPSPAGLWRIRNIIVWARPNPAPGALADKFRPATSYITVACRGARRYFDLDAVRGPASTNSRPRLAQGGPTSRPNDLKVPTSGSNRASLAIQDGDGTAPPLDWHTDDHPEDGDWLWKMPTAAYKGAHYATFPLELPTRLIMAMCPQRVCTVCGKPSERIAETTNAVGFAVQRSSHIQDPDGAGDGRRDVADINDAAPHWAERRTLGWTDCGHDAYRTGTVLDPFVGSGTTLEAAQNVGRSGLGFDLDHRNADLARRRVGMFMTVDEP